MGKRIMVTGGFGFVGSNLTRKLVEEGIITKENKVIIVDSLEPRHGGNPHNLKGLVEYIEFHHLNIRDSRSMRKIMKGVDIIFHIAGQVNHMDGEKKPEKDLQINLVSTLDLLQDAIEVAPHCKIINASTRQFYGNVEGPFNEETPAMPVDFNGIFLLAGDLVMKHFYKVHGLRTVNLRLTNLYGPRQLVKRIEGNPQGVIPVFIRQVIQGETINVMYNDTGRDAVRDPLYIDDAIDAFLLAAAEPTDGKTYVVGGKEHITLTDIANILINFTGKGNIVRIPLPPERKRINITQAICDYTKINKELGWEPKIDLREGLKRTVEFYEHPENKEHYF